MKILASDYDRTFDIEIDKNLKAVEEFRSDGNLFIFNTGRSFIDFKNKVEEYNLKYDYAILNHGATIIDKFDNVLYNLSIDNSIINNIIDDLNLDNAIEVFSCSLLDSSVDINHSDLTKIHVRYNTFDEASNIGRLINEKYKDYVKSYHVSPNLIEITSNKVNKSKGIKELLEFLKLNDIKVYTIGDGCSDISMIKDYNGYSIVGSIDEVKKSATKEIKCVADLIDEIKR